MRIIITATLIYLIFKLIRFVIQIKINSSDKNAGENLQNSFRNMDILDADYEDVNKDNS